MMIKNFFKYSFRFLSVSILSLGLGGILFGGFYISKTLEETPKITEKMLETATGGTTKMYDSAGNLIYLDTEHLRDYIKSEEIPQKYKDLLLATEDSEYYQENGYSIKGLANAVLGMIKEKIFHEGEARGGSTIEQQLIKNLVFSSSDKDRTINRKIKEIWLAMQMDKNFSKEQILEWYVNLIFLGENSYGANTISNTYYGVSLKDLTGDDAQTLSKLAIITGLGQSPSSYNLYDNPEAVEKRRNIVLQGAYEKGVISEQQLKDAKAVPVQEGLKERFWRNNEVLATTTQHSAYVSSALKQVESLGYDLSKTPMQIYTALDQQYNSDVKYIIDTYEGYQDGEQQIAATIIDPTTGFVKAQYGGRNSEAFGLNRATQTSRSTGSSTKPFISYGPAIEYAGYGSGTSLDSSNYVYPGTNFVAKNYGGYTYGNVTMERALQLSLNTPAIRVLDNVTGSNNTKQFLAGMNMDVQDSYGGQDALGLSLSTEHLAGAVATLANLGEYQTPQYVTKIVFNDGSEKEINFNKTRAMKQSTAYVLLKMMEKVAQADGTASKIAISNYQGYAVKTGTVAYDESLGFGDVASDNWTIGTTKSASIAVWTGYDNPNEYGHQINYYLNNDKKVFQALMLYANEGKDTSDWAKPDTVTQNGAYYYPNDTNSVSAVTYDIPQMTTGNETSVGNLTAQTKITVGDEGMSAQYTKATDYDQAITWQNTADSTYISYWKNGYSSAGALSISENAFTGQ